jgi:ABC transport system ATP-binding/permease protein
MPTLVIRNPDGSQQEQEVAEQLTIGRAEGNDLILSEGGVSRKHARFFVEGTELRVEDTGSANGTWVDGSKIESATVLNPKSQVVIGDYEIVVKLGSKALPKAERGKASNDPTSTSGKPVKAAPARSTRVVGAVKPSGQSASKRPVAQRSAGPQLRGLSGVADGKTLSLSGTMIVGRVAGVDLQLDDDSVSRRHAELTVEGRQVSLKDLGSANGTSVNGAPISEDTILNAGDVIQFGVVEMIFENGGASGSKVPVRRGSGAPAAPVSSRAPARRNFEPSGLAQRDEAPPPMDPGLKQKLMLAGAVASALLVGVLAMALLSNPDPIQKDVPLPGARIEKPVAVELTPEEQMERSLTECRTYSATDSLEPPNWDRAEKACQKVLEIDPIQGDANTLLKKIEVERKCEQSLNKGKELLTVGKEEDALASFAEVKTECPIYHNKALELAKDPLEHVKKEMGLECKKYASGQKWDNAYKQCEAYIKLACQTMAPADLYPPALMKVKLDGAMNKKTDWRPKDPLYINFLKARAKVKPGEPPWQCQEITVFRPPPPPPDPGRVAKEEFKSRYPDPEMARAASLYYDGKFNEAVVPLQKMRESMAKAALHDAAKDLLAEISEASNYFSAGQSDLQTDKLEQADKNFKKALEVDARLVLGAKKYSDDEKRRELERRLSFVRRHTIDAMSVTAYQSGKTFAEHKDFAKACKRWKLGAEYSRSNQDLLKALTNICTAKANDLLARGGCPSFKMALEYAVDGDGLKDKVTEAALQDNCPGFE